MRSLKKMSNEAGRYPQDRPAKADDVRDQMARSRMDPLCGWDWLSRHWNDPYPDPTIVLSLDGRRIATIKGCVKPGAIKQIMASVRR